MIKTNSKKTKIIDQIKKIPNLPGVYLFKSENNEILYIGKAKNLKSRVSSYFKNQNIDWKINSIVKSSENIDFITTKNELAALLLEAELIQANQPKFNILLKSGQPFIYIMISSPAKKLPELKIIRNKKEKGTYFGPFLEKIPTRKVYNFLIKTFKIKLCKKQIPNGCLDYHLGICAGTCLSNFNKDTYLKRLELAKLALQKGHKKFLLYLKLEIKKFNKNLEFEKSKELYDYQQAFEKVFESLDNNINTKTFSTKDIWILTSDKKELFLFKEKNGALKKKESFVFPLNTNHIDYFKSYYQSFSCSNTILINFEFDSKEKNLFEKFLQKWHKKENKISIIKPKTGHFVNLIKLATIHSEQEIKK